MNFLFPVFAFAGLTLVTAVCWWLMARRPEQWARWVERENSFWVNAHLISATFAARMKRWETGTPLRLLLAVTTMAGFIGFLLTMSVLVKAIQLENRRVPKLYNPALQPTPTVHPATNRPAANRPPTNHPPAKIVPAGATNKNARP